MKKLLSLGILFLVLMAFSGFASASYVTDKGYKVTVPKGPCDDERHLYTWQSTHFNDKEITFRVIQYSQYLNNHKWVNREITKYSINYKKTKYNKMVMGTSTNYIRYGWTTNWSTGTSQRYVYSHYSTSSHQTKTTKHSANYMFKHSKQKIIKSIIKSGDKD